VARHRGDGQRASTVGAFEIDLRARVEEGAHDRDVPDEDATCNGAMPEPLRAFGSAPRTTSSWTKRRQSSGVRSGLRSGREVQGRVATMEAARAFAPPSRRARSVAAVP
jgi:hypothetical protein